MMKNQCKRCLLSEAAGIDAFELVKQAINKIPENEKCEESLYFHRLALCKKCDNLLSGTCFKCGCYVELRAAFKNQKCPDASNRKW